MRAAVRESTGLDRVVVSGLAGEFIQYLTTPEEYDRQHYEGGSTLYGPLSSNLLRQELAELSPPARARRARAGRLPARPDQRRVAGRAALRPGAAGGTIAEQPARRGPPLRAGRLRLAGRRRTGSTGPLGRAFVVVQRRDGGPLAQRRQRPRPRHAVEGRRRGCLPRAVGGAAHRGRGPLPAPGPGQALPADLAQLPGAAREHAHRARSSAAPAGRVAVALDYPAAVRDLDLRHRPPSASGGVVRFQVGDRTVVVRQRRGTVFAVEAHRRAVRVSIPGGRRARPARERERRGVRRSLGARRPLPLRAARRASVTAAVKGWRSSRVSRLCDPRSGPRRIDAIVLSASRTRGAAAHRRSLRARARGARASVRQRRPAPASTVRSPAQRIAAVSASRRRRARSAATPVALAAALASGPATTTR